MVITKCATWRERDEVVRQPDSHSHSQMMLSSSWAWRGGGASSSAAFPSSDSLLPPPPPTFFFFFFFWRLTSAAASALSAWGLWHAVRRRRLLFVGEKLRDADIERLQDQSWRDFTDALLSLIVFRSQISLHFLCSLFFLLSLKAMHCLALSRADFLHYYYNYYNSSSSNSSAIASSPSSSSAAAHRRIVSSIFALLLIDCLLLYSSSINPPPPPPSAAAADSSVLLLFPFEYTILAVSTFASLLEFTSHSFFFPLLDRTPCCRSWRPCFDTAVLAFYLDLLLHIARFSLYLLFSLLVFLKYGFPLHLVREVYTNFRRVKCRLSELLHYQKTTSDMNERFPDATKKELREGDAMCIICREEMVTAKKLQCDHKFHVRCLRSWLERQQACPICRAPVT